MANFDTKRPGPHRANIKALKCGPSYSRSGDHAASRHDLMVPSRLVSFWRTEVLVREAIPELTYLMVPWLRSPVLY
jgi:hypothetical protein